MVTASAKTLGHAGSRSERSRAVLANPVGGQRTDIISVAGRIAIYAAGSEQSGPPLLLVHSVNAAASAFEIKPLYDHYARSRRVYAVDLPGFGQSERGNQHYTARMMTDALHEVVERIQIDERVKLRQQVANGDPERLWQASKCHHQPD